MNKKTTEHFLSCDWGTSSFRLRLVETGSLRTIAEEKSAEGIAATYRQWQQTSEVREDYFAAVINRRTDLLEKKTGIPLKDTPVALSGMASSSIGMVELPYKQLPFSLSGEDLSIHTFQKFIVISGACSANDVMRGEETKITGCAALFAGTSQEQWLLMPGTHPKHVVVKDNKVAHFQSFMTGEFFDLLSSHSILAASVSDEGTIDDPVSFKYFSEGLHAGQSGNLLHEMFMVRTNQLLKKIPSRHNRFYLSGLLIGAELKSVPSGTPVHLVAGPLHASLYMKACQVLNIPVTSVTDADEALVRGQLAVISSLFR